MYSSIVYGIQYFVNKYFSIDFSPIVFFSSYNACLQCGTRSCKMFCKDFKVIVMFYSKQANFKKMHGPGQYERFVKTKVAANGRQKKSLFNIVDSCEFLLPLPRFTWNWYQI